MTSKVKTQSIEVKKINRMRNSLPESPPPPLRHPRFAMELCYLLWGYRNGPRPPRGTGGTRGALMTNDAIVTSFGG